MNLFLKHQVNLKILKNYFKYEEWQCEKVFNIYYAINFIFSKVEEKSEKIFNIYYNIFYNFEKLQGVVAPRL